MSISNWTPDCLEKQDTKTILITGANSGIGLEAAKILASKNTRLILACRRPDKAAQAVKEILACEPNASVQLETLDLSSLKSVADMVESFSRKHQSLDVLINNAGVMMVPYQKTVDGFELQLATNHLGHFKLTALLLPLLEESGGRIVNVSSVAHRRGKINFDDINGEQSYSPWKAYAQSKLANLLFTQELHRRLQKRGSQVKAIACHPGYASTNLALVGPEMQGKKLMTRFALWSNKYLAQSAVMGSYPTVLAALDPRAESGAFYGPLSWRGMRGLPGNAPMAKSALDEGVALKLWLLSEKLVKMGFDSV